MSGRDFPLHPEQIATRDNDHRPMPQQLISEGRRRLLTFSNREGKVLDVNEVIEAATRTDFGISLPADVFEGVLADGRRDTDIPDVADVAPARLPDWTGPTFHPRLSVPYRHRTLMRLSGERRLNPNIVKGSDDRVVYYPAGYPWHCIGRVYVWNDASATGWAWSGSAALISENAVLTAGHVIPWGATSWKAKFVPAHYDGVSIYGAGFERWVTNAYGYDSSGEVAGYDAAVMRLQSPLSTLGYFGSRVYSSSWNDEPYWTHCGYAGAVSGTRPNFQNGIEVHDTDSDSPGLEVEHNGDVTGGDSGGPLFAWWDEGPYIVGTHSGDETEWHFPFSFPRINVDAGGNAMNNLVTWARANW